MTAGAIHKKLDINETETFYLCSQNNTQNSRHLEICTLKIKHQVHCKPHCRFLGLKSYCIHFA